MEPMRYSTTQILLSLSIYRVRLNFRASLMRDSGTMTSLHIITILSHSFGQIKSHIFCHSIIEDVNISQQFEMVTTPLHDVHTSLGSISSTALDAFNDLLDTPLCPFSGDQYDESTIRQPWIANVKKGFTAWDSINGKKVNYSRQSGENAIQYITRIYDVPDPSCSSFTSLIHDGYQIYG